MRAGEFAGRPPFIKPGSFRKAQITSALTQEHDFGVANAARTFVQGVPGTSAPRTGATPGCGTAIDIPALNALALRSLGALFEPREGLFRRSLTWNGNGFQQEQTSRRRTIIALLGLQRLEEAGCAQPFDLAAIRDVLLAGTDWVQSVGDLGLLTWFTAVVAPERLCGLFHEFDFDRAIESYQDGRIAQTRGLAWFLAGISHALLAATASVPDLTDVAADAYHLLLENQAESGLFGHAAHSGLLRRVCRKRFGTFSDQIHAIYALATFTRAFQIEEPLEPALNCANSIRALQGGLGEWWYLYDKRTCRVANRYPVLSCHQVGTAPIGLLALEEVTGHSFHQAVYKGLSWVTGVNVLGKDLRSLGSGLIWDSMGVESRAANYWETALSLMNISHALPVDSLGIRFEARPDHYGWLLFAFGRLGLPKATANDAASAG